MASSPDRAAPAAASVSGDQQSGAGTPMAASGGTTAANKMGSFRLIVDPRKEEYVPGTFFKQEKDLENAVKILQDTARDQPDNASLWRKLARFSYRLWHLNLNTKTLTAAKDAYQQALSITENQSVPSLWAECAVVYTSAGAYDGAIQLYNNLIMDCPAFAKMPKVYLQLAAVYRRRANYDMAYHYLLLTLREKSGPIPEPLTQQHVIMQMAYTYELRAAALARAEGRMVDVLEEADGSDSTAAVSAGAVFDALPSSVAECARAAREGYRESYLQQQEARLVAGAPPTAADGEDPAEARAREMESFWRAPADDGWKAWRLSWRQWLGQGVLYGKHGYDVFAADAFNEALALGAGQFLTTRPAPGLMGDTRTTKIGVLESRFLARRKEALSDAGLDTSAMVTKHEEEMQADVWLLAARVALRAGDDKLAPVAAEKVLERRPVSQYVAPTRSMLAKCGSTKVREAIEARAGRMLVFRIAAWRARTHLKRKHYNARRLIIRAYRWYRCRRWAQEVGRPRLWARAVLQRTFCWPRMELRKYTARRSHVARRIQFWYRSIKMLRRLVWRREKWRETFRDRVREAIPKLQAWFRGYPLHYRWRNYKWAVPVVQCAWRCFYARLTLFYLRLHKHYVNKALTQRDLARVGSVTMPRKFVRQRLRNRSTKMLALLSADERHALREHQAGLASTAADLLASVVGTASAPVPARTFVETLLSDHIDASGTIHRKPRRTRRRSLPRAAGDTATALAGAGASVSPGGRTLHRPSSMPSTSVGDGGGLGSLDSLPSAPPLSSVDRLLGRSAASPSRTAADPLSGYFLPEVWRRAQEFARKDADADADGVLEGRKAAERAKNVEKWAAMRAKRDATLERMRYRPAAKPQRLGYGPEGPYSKAPPPVLSVLRAKALPASNRGVALATAVAVQDGTGMEQGVNMALGRGMTSPLSRKGTNTTAAALALPPLPPASPVHTRRRHIPGSKVAAKLPVSRPTPIDTVLQQHSLRDPSPSPSPLALPKAARRAAAVHPSAAASVTTTVVHKPPPRRGMPVWASPVHGAAVPDGDDAFFQSVEELRLPGGDYGSGGDSDADSFSDSDPDELAAPYDPKARPSGVGGARGYVYAREPAFAGSSYGGGELRDEGSGWTRFKSTDGDLWGSTLSRRSKFRADDSSEEPPQPAQPHPSTRLPGRMCVELEAGDAKAFYGNLMGRLVTNLVKWQRTAPFHWRGMLAKRAEDIVDVAMRTHHVDCDAKSCKVMRGLLELVRRARVTSGYTLRDYVLYMRGLTKHWAPDVVREAPSSGAAARPHGGGLADLAFPLPALPRPDVSVRQRVTSLASRAESLRQARAGMRQSALRTGGLLTTSMQADATLGSPFGATTAATPAYLALSMKHTASAPLLTPVAIMSVDRRPVGMAGATLLPPAKDTGDPLLEAETRKYRSMFRSLLMEQLRMKKWDSVATVLDTMSATDGMAPSLDTLMAVVAACAKPFAGRRHDGAYGPGEVSLKAVACATWSGATASIDLYHAALTSCASNRGHWQWAVYTYKSLQEAGCEPTDVTHDLMVKVCSNSVTAADREAAYTQLQAAGVPLHIAFNATQDSSAAVPAAGAAATSRRPTKRK